jgi:Ribbon-helix-helix domain
MVSAFPSALLASNEDARPDKRSSLVIRNVNVNGHRTSIRLEPQIWDSMAEICRREFCTPHDVCSYVAERKPRGARPRRRLRRGLVDLLFRVQHEICGSNERIGQINEIIQDAEVWPSSRVWQIR